MKSSLDLNYMKLLLVFATLALSSLTALLSPSHLSSANLTSVKDTLQTSRLSWGARIESTGTTVGSSNVLIQSAPAVPYNSTSTANLRAGDSITINANTYTVVGIIDADEFTVTPVIAAGDADDGDPIQLRMQPRHVITLTTATAVANGSFRVLIPADATTPNDGNIDDEGYDFNTTVDVTASNVTGYTFGTGTSTAYGGTNCTSPANYHCFDIAYTGAGAIGATITINIGNTNGTNSLISPGETAAHVEGTADTYPIIVRNYASGADPDAVAPIDATTVRVAQIESVRVTATVDPTISFTIAGVSTATSTCGATPDINTATAVNAPLAVPFGSLTLNTFKDASHQLTVSTNASGGYAVTAVENDQMSRDGLGVVTIPDTTCDNGLCTTSSEEEWNTAVGNPGFGYSVENISAANVPFEYTSSGGSFAARPFPLPGSESIIFNSTTVADAEDVYVCYRISVSATQAAGDYENQITYTATGTF
jgi:hypothetical protein